VEGSGQLPFLIAAAEQEHLNYRSSPHLARHKNILQSTLGEESYAMAIKEIWECFQVHFLELLGAVFTKSSLEKLEYAVSKSENALQDLFNHHIEELEMIFLPKRLYSGGGSTVSNIPMLEIIVVVIFLIHDSHTQVQTVATTSETSFATTLLRFCCFVASILVKKAAQSEKKSLNFLLPGVIVFMEWVVSQPSFVKDIKVEHCCIVFQRYGVMEFRSRGDWAEHNFQFKESKVTTNKIGDGIGIVILDDGMQV